MDDRLIVDDGRCGGGHDAIQMVDVGVPLPKHLRRAAPRSIGPLTESDLRAKVLNQELDNIIAILDARM